MSDTGWKVRAERAEAELERVQRQCATMREALSVLNVMHEMDTWVKAYPLFKRFIEHTPLETDIAPMASQCVKEILDKLPGDPGRDLLTREQVMPMVAGLLWMDANWVPTAHSSALEQADCKLCKALAHAKSLGLLPP